LPIILSARISALALGAALLLPAADSLAIVDTRFLQYENGPSQLAGHEFRGGDQIWFDARVQGFARTEADDPEFAIAWHWRAIDAQGRELVRGGQGHLRAELAREDKDYRPRIRFDFQLPLLLPRGQYAIELTVTDEIAKAEKKHREAIPVGGRPLDAASELTAGGFRFFRAETDRRPLDAAVYRGGDAVWLRFDIAGFRHGPRNKVDVAYGMLVLGPSGQPFLREENAAHFETATFYPQFHLPASVQLMLPAKASPGEYVVLLTLKDAVSGQTAAVRTGFTVE